jgi:hypothetical protein
LLQVASVGAVTHFMQQVQNHALEEGRRDRSKKFQYLGCGGLAQLRHGCFKLVIWAGHGGGRCRGGLWRGHFFRQSRRLQLHPNEIHREFLRQFGRERSWMTSGERQALRSELPEAALGRTGKAGSLQTIMRPARPILVDLLRATRQHLGTILVGQTEC